jgi:hypothetical protein
MSPYLRFSVWYERVVSVTAVLFFFMFLVCTAPAGRGTNEERVKRKYHAAAGKSANE